MAKRPKYVIEFKAPNWKSVGIFSANMLNAMQLITGDEHARIRRELDEKYDATGVEIEAHETH